MSNNKLQRVLIVYNFECLMYILRTNYMLTFVVMEKALWNKVNRLWFES